MSSAYPPPPPPPSRSTPPPPTAQPWNGRHWPGEAASRGRAWLAGLADQAVLVGFFLLALGTALLLPDSSGEGLRAGLVVTAAVGALVLMLVECWCLVVRRATVGLWLAGVRGSRSVRVGLDDALEHFAYFWPSTVLLVAGSLFGDRGPSGLVHDPRGSISPWARAVGWVVLLASPVPLVVALAG
ncbi:hypothetical protein GCM10023340_33230 [Nocardioides marinquilinus]|uniref:RDD family protein n=1 Tax=Nocardioides marinquilinus TaxID=1210400 RepID=A0ABP9PVM6_9ACTN